jgi:ATP-dependent HslUV protease ATP-binding subunit HslU
VRDLMEIAVKLVKDEEQAKFGARGARRARRGPPARRCCCRRAGDAARWSRRPRRRRRAAAGREQTREKLRELLRAGKLDEREVEIDVNDPQHPCSRCSRQGGMDQIGFDQHQGHAVRGSAAARSDSRSRSAEALELLTNEEAGKLIDMHKVTREAVWRAENNGIVFLDEIDKIAHAREAAGGPTSRARACSATCCRSSKARR